jgi:predicted PurR-regulated permease PerM
MPGPHQDLTRTTLGVLSIGALLAASFWVMRPFLPAIVWALTLVITTWPLMLKVQHRVGNRRGMAVAIMTIVLLLLVIVPLWLAISTIVNNIDELGGMVRAVLSLQIPDPPDWVAAVPVVGGRASKAWAGFASLEVHELAPKLMPYAGLLTRWFADLIGGLGAMLLQFLLVIGIAALMYARGEAGATAVIRFGHRLGGEPGATAVRLAGQAIRSVALGVVVTAIVQSLLGGIGLAVVGLPYAPVLTAVIFILCLAQLGPGLVLLPAVAWMYHADRIAGGTILLGFTVGAMTIDNFLRPMLIQRGAHLPLFLVLAGVIGGLIAYGLLGIFLGPTVLAVAYTLLNAWVNDVEVGDRSSAPP